MWTQTNLLFLFIHWHQHRPSIDCASYGSRIVGLFHHLNPVSELSPYGSKAFFVHLTIVRWSDSTIRCFNYLGWGLPHFKSRCSFVIPLCNTYWSFIFTRQTAWLTILSWTVTQNGLVWCGASVSIFSTVVLTPAFKAWFVDHGSNRCYIGMVDSFPDLFYIVKH